MSSRFQPATDCGISSADDKSFRCTKTLTWPERVAVVAVAASAAAAADVAAVADRGSSCSPSVAGCSC